MITSLIGTKLVNFKQKLGLNWTKITNIGTKLNIKHWFWHVAHYWVDTWTFIKFFLKKITKWHVAQYCVDTCTFKKNLKKFKKNSKNSKKPRSDTWQSLFITINDLNGISKKRPNWTKLTKIRTYLNTKPKLGLI